MTKRFRLVLLSCLGSSNPPLIAHFIDYYRSLGVDQFLLVLHSDTADSAERRDALHTLRSRGVEPVGQWVGTYLSRARTRRLYDLADAHVRPEDWVLNPDADEFVECDRFSADPTAFRELLHLCDTFGYTFVRGHLLDMVAPGGALPPIRPDVPLWRQFPIACNLSKKVLHANCHKIVACRGFHRCTPGAHKVIGIGKQPFPRVLRVNHFKWDNSVVPRLQQRREVYARAGYSQVTESIRLLEHVRHHGGIDLGTVDFRGRTSPLGKWAISPDLLRFMVTSLPIGSQVLELGSGHGTEELARFFSMHSVEHDEKWVGRFDSRYIHAPLRGTWYDPERVAAGLKGLEPSAILVDGPPAVVGVTGSHAT